MTNYNLYIKKSRLKVLKNRYSDSIQILNDLYFELEETIKNIESQNIWEGESYDKFIEKFDTWKLDYLKSINRLIILKNFIEDVIAAADILITERDGLMDSNNII